MNQPLQRLLLLLLLLLPALAACSAEPRVAENAIVISVDTLRADRLGCYGYELPTSPHIDALAAAGVVFDDASSTSPWTLPAHASLLSGRYAPRHGVRTIGRTLAPDLPTLASSLAANGFATGAVANLRALQDTHRLLESFDAVEIVPSDQSATGAARRVTQAAVSWLERRRDERTLLFVHFYDVHSDYRSRPSYERLFTERTLEHQGSTGQILAIAGGARISPEEAERLSRLYDAGIRQLDEELGRLFGWLEERGSLEDTLVVLTSDHGEEFFDHGPDAPAGTVGVSHGHSLYQELVRVPLILSGPGIPRGIRVSEPVSLVDVMSTVLEALGVETPSGLDGRPLQPLFRGNRPIATRPLFFETSRSQRTPTLDGVRRGPYKLVMDAETGRHELYHLLEDPREERDLSDERREVVERLGRDLRWIRSQRRTAESGELSDETKERLRALGYL